MWSVRAAGGVPDNRMTIFGGSSGRNAPIIFADTWVLTDANGLGGTPSWTERGPFTKFPAPRFEHTAVYNSSTNLMTIFGGLVTADETLATNDVFVLTHADSL